MSFQKYCKDQKLKEKPNKKPQMKKIKNKKGVVNQIFMYILGLFLVAIILLYGYNSVQKIIQSKQKIEIVEFQDTLIKTAKSITSDYNSILVFDINNKLITPQKVRVICFVDNKDANPSCQNQDFCKYYEYFNETYSISEASLDKSKFDNVYAFDKNDKLVMQFNIGVVEINNKQEDFFCVNVSGYLPVRLRGLGDRIEISEVQ